MATCLQISTRIFRMRHGKAICCFMTVIFCVYIAISLSLDLTSIKNDIVRITNGKIESYHQLILKGKWIVIPRTVNESLNTKHTNRTKSSYKRSLCHTFVGRLGNTMFQYASIYSVGRINGLRLVMSSSFNLRNIFANLVESTNSFRPCLYYTKLFERDPYQFESAITSLPNDTDYLVEGFLQSWRYFEPFKTEIHRQFTFKKHVANMAKFSLETALDSFRRTRNPTIPIRTYVGIHVRRGDYAKLLLSRSVGINLPTSTYFHTAKNYFRSLYPSPVFVVCSDDIAWCENNIGTDDAVFIRGNTPEVDLAILASLNHTITSFGTFTFWAAWLANGTTVYPKTIVDENFGDRRDIYLRDHVYPTWIPL